MRFFLFIVLLAVLIFPGCAYQGKVVRKEFRALPFSESLGVDAIYTFQLRDRAGEIHSQMVTPEVFANYEVGDYFDDLQAAPAHDYRPAAPLPPALEPLPGRRPLEYYETPYRPLRSGHF